jgi:hypothetical protein
VRTSVLLSLLIVLCWRPAATQKLMCPAPVTKLLMDNGQYSPVEGAVFNLRNFSATMVARGREMPLCFARMPQVQQGEVLISSESLSRLFQRKIQQSKSQFSDIKIEINDNVARLSGKMHKGVTVPFEIEGPVSTDGTVLLLRAKQIKAEGMPMKGLLEMLGKNLGSLLGSESVDGVTAQGDTLVFRPSKIAYVRGSIAKAQTSAKGLMVTFAERGSKAAQ